jgi:hypothetical protein
VRIARTLDTRASFWTCAAVIVHTLWTSAAPAVTYPLYSAKWHLTTTMVTAVFAVYPAVVVVVLLLFGNISDYIGRRLPILIGLSASLVGAFLFAVAPNIGWVFVGRIFMGIGVGLSAGPATAAMVEFNTNPHPAYASTMNTAAQAIGFGTATLIGGALVQYAPFPTHLNFWVLFVVIASILVIAWRLPRPVERVSLAKWRPGSIVVPGSEFRTFVTSALLVTAAYALGAVVLSLGAHIAEGLIGSKNAFVSGLAISMFAVTNGVITIGARGLSLRFNVLLGTTSALIGMLLLALSVGSHSLGIFLATSAFAGAAYSMQFRAGLAVIVERAPGEHRAGILSAIYLIAYLFMGSIALSLGALATARGLKVSIDIGCVIIAVLSATGFLLASSTQRAARSRQGRIAA